MKICAATLKCENMNTFEIESQFPFAGAPPVVCHCQIRWNSFLITAGSSFSWLMFVCFSLCAPHLLRPAVYSSSYNSIKDYSLSNCLFFMLMGRRKKTSPRAKRSLFDKRYLPQIVLAWIPLSAIGTPRL